MPLDAQEDQHVSGEGLLNQVEETNLDETKAASDQLENEVNLPPHLQSMDLEELQKAYQNIEKDKSRLGNEVGKLRQINDDLIESQIAPKVQAEEKPVEFDDIVENPADAISKAVNSNDKVQNLTTELNKLKAQQAESFLKQRHPDIESLIQSDGFREFVNSNPVTKQAVNNAQQYQDAQALDGVVSLFKQMSGTEAQAASTEKKKAALKDASLESGTTGSVTKKRWKRSEIQKLKQHDPSKYNVMRAEISKAYINGDVINDID